MTYITPIINFLKPYAITLVQNLVPTLIENIILNKRKKELTMADTITTTTDTTTTTDALKDTTTAVVQTVATIAEASAEDNLKTQMQTKVAEFTAKEQAEIATTKSSYVKLRDQMYITLLATTETALEAEISVLGVKALAQLEKLIAKL
jgi:hypothetical protein